MTAAEYLVQQAVNAISAGSLYALMAIGLAMVFGILRLVNFAHGDIIMAGSYATLLLNLAGLPFWAAAASGIVISGGVGVIMERLAYRPIRGSGDVAMLLLDYGPCGGCPTDLDGSGTVDFGDIALALLSFG